MKVQFSSVQSLSCIRLFATPWTAAHQAPYPSAIPGVYSLMSIESVMPSNHLILCHPLLLQPSVFPSIRVFSKEAVHCIRWPKYWSFTLSIFGILQRIFRTDFYQDGLGGSLCSPRDSQESSPTTQFKSMYTRGGFMSMHGKTNTVL